MSWKDSIASATLQVNIIGFIWKITITDQAIEKRQVPVSSLPLRSEMKTRLKTAEKPDKATAIEKHQTRMTTSS